MIKSQIFKSAFSIIALFVVFGFVEPGSAQAQATFQVAGTTTTITSTGQTELVGTVTFTVMSGTTQAGRLEFFLPNVRIVNNAASGIGVTGTGGLAGATILSVVPDSGIVIIQVPAGAVTGASLTLSGVRISAVGQTFTTLNAAISSTANSILAGQNSPQVVRDVTDGLVVDSTSQTIITVANGVLATAPAAIIVSEGWEKAFSSDVGIAGQTVKSQVIFQVTGLPENVTVTFPGLVTSSNTGSTLVTSGGAPVAVTSDSATQRVVYEFTGSAGSAIVIDSFLVTPDVSFTGAPGTGTAVIQAALGPIGAAIPDSNFPSTDIPRFAELFVPPLSSIPIPVATRTLTVSIPNPSDDAAITISNTTSGGAITTVRARREDGTLATTPGITSEITRNLASHQTATFSLKDLFGPSAASAGISAVDVESQNTGLIVNSVSTISSHRFANTPIPDAGATYFPFDRASSSENPLLTVHNTGSTDTAVSITLRNSTGSTLAAVQRTVPTLGAVRESFSTLFASVSVPLEGYLIVRSAGTPVRASLVNNPSTRPDEVPLLPQIVTSPTIFPFFAFGSGYRTALELINPSEVQSVRVLLSAFSPTGTSLTPQPYVRTLAASERQNFDFASIFGTGPAGGLTVGYFSVSLESTTVSNPFASAPSAFGLVRVSTDTFTTVLPFSPLAGTQFYLTPGVENSAAYTGLAIVNPTGAGTSLTVDAFSASGNSLGSATFTLGANNARIQLLRELLPQAVNNDNVLIRIQSSPASVRLIAFRGALNVSELIYLAGQTTN